MAMNLATFIGQFEQAVEGTAPGSIAGETVFRDLPNWDSLAVLNIVTMISLEYDVEFDAAALHVCQTVNDIFQAVQAKKAA